MFILKVYLYYNIAIEESVVDQQELLEKRKDYC
jgi:hypothetical protein